jgi:integrase
VRFHDLRHTGRTLAALAGATQAELMQRLGHSTAAAALGYLHTTQDHSRAVA